MTTSIDVPRARGGAAATCLLLVLLLLALASSPAHAHDWIGANGTPDCECLPHFKLDCKNLAPVQKAWRTLVSRNCNATVDSEAAATPRGQKVSMLQDAAASATATAPAKPGHAGHEGHEEEEELPTYKCAVDQQCYEAYHVVIGHHYGCAPDFLPREIGEGIHLFQTPGDGRVPDVICQGCFMPRYVDRKSKPAPPPCPKLSCHHNEEVLLGNLTLAADKRCADDCSSPACRDAYRFLRVHHDGCVLNDNPLPSRMSADRLRAACAKHECVFSNGTFVREADGGVYAVDCDSEKNAGPFRAPGLLVKEKVEVDHSAHNHGAASTAPANSPPAAVSGAAAARVSAAGLAAAAGLAVAIAVGMAA